MTKTHFNNEETLLHQMVETIVREVMRGLIPTLTCSWLKRSRFRHSAAVARRRRACIWR